MALGFIVVLVVEWGTHAKLHCIFLQSILATQRFAWPCCICCGSMHAGMRRQFGKVLVRVCSSTFLVLAKKLFLSEVLSKGSVFPEAHAAMYKALMTG